MGRIYDTDYKTAPASVLQAASGKGILDAIANYADVRQKSDYKKSVQDKLTSGSLTDLMAVDQSKLSDRDARALTNRMANVRQMSADERAKTLFNQQQTLFNQQQQERSADAKYRERYNSQDKRIDDTDTVLELGGDISFSPSDQELFNKVYAGKSDAPNWADVDGMVRSLKAAGGTDDQIKSILDTHKRKEDWEAASDESEKSDVWNKTQTELVEGAMPAGGYVTTAMQKALQDAKAADVTTRQTRASTGNALIASLLKERNKMAREVEKVDIRGGSGGKTRYSKTYLKPNELPKVKMDEQKSMVANSVGKLFNAGDAADVESYYKKYGNDDKAAYIVDRMVDYALLGNSLYGANEKAGLAEQNKYAKEYDKMVNGKGFSGRNTQGYKNETNRQIMEVDARIAAEQRKLEGVGLSRSGARQEYTKDLFKGPHDSGWRPTEAPKVLKNSKDPEGQGTYSEVTDGYISRQVAGGGTVPSGTADEQAKIVAIKEQLKNPALNTTERRLLQEQLPADAAGVVTHVKPVNTEALRKILKESTTPQSPIAGRLSSLLAGTDYRRNVGSRDIARAAGVLRKQGVKSTDDLQNYALSLPDGSDEQLLANSVYDDKMMHESAEYREAKTNAQLQQAAHTVNTTFEYLAMALGVGAATSLLRAGKAKKAVQLAREARTAAARARKPLPKTPETINMGPTTPKVDPLIKVFEEAAKRKTAEARAGNFTWSLPK